MTATEANDWVAAAKKRQAAEAARIARAEAVKAIAAAMPLLTAEQRAALRPILAGGNAGRERS